MKTKYWLFILLPLLVLCLGLSLWLLRPQQADYAEVWSQGQLLYTLELSKNRVLTVETPQGSNEITVRDGSIAVTLADCPDQRCKSRGFCTGGTPIICLPHGLEIRFVEPPEIDGVAGQ